MGNQKTGVDIVEVGRGNESKVIGQNDSITEYVAGAIAVVSFISEFALGAWVVLSCALYWGGFTAFWSCIISGAIVIVVYVLCFVAFLRLVSGMRDAHLPEQRRDEETGRFIPVYQGGQHRFNLFTVAKRKK